VQTPAPTPAAAWQSHTQATARQRRIADLLMYVAMAAYLTLVATRPADSAGAAQQPAMASSTPTTGVCQ
jgi:hypothetical protein